MWFADTLVRACYNPDIFCRRIGARGTPKVRVSDRSPTAAAFRSRVLPRATRMLVSIPIRRLFTSHFIEPFRSYLINLW